MRMGIVTADIDIFQTSQYAYDVRCVFTCRMKANPGETAGGAFGSDQAMFLQKETGIPKTMKLVKLDNPTK